MNCQQFEQSIIRLACDQVSDEFTRTAALSHAQSCANCGARLSRQQNIAAGLHALAADESDIQAPAHLAATLQAAFEKQMNPVTEKHAASLTAFNHWFDQWLNWRGVASLASFPIMIALAATVLLRIQTTKRTRMPVIVNAPKPVADKHNLNHHEPARQKTVRQLLAPSPKRRSPQRVKVLPRETEEYGALISLMPIVRTDSEEIQQIVRMQIPRTTLRLWGLPLHEESNQELVSAEVYFSEDGVARAIRLRN